MPFRRNNFRQRPRQMSVITSVKNQRTEKQTTIANANIEHVVAIAVEQGVPTKVIGNEVPVGAKIFRVILTINYVSASSAETGTFDWCCMKLREGQTVTSTIVTPDWTNIGLSNARNQVFRSDSTLVGTEDAGPYRRLVSVKIPKIYQRMRAGDSLVLVTRSDIAGVSNMGSLYKYYQ